MRRAISSTVLVLALGAAPVAWAEPGLSNKVYDPYVKNGVTEVEVRAGRLNGGPLDGEAAAVVELERGLNDRVSVAVLGEFEQHAGEERKLDAIAVEGVAYLGQLPGLGVDVGGYLEYEQRIHNESGVLEAKLLLAKQLGAVQALVNLIAQQALTDRKGEGDMDFGYAAQATMEAAPNLKAGLQAFGDLGSNRHLGGRRAHYLGPVINWETHPAWMPGELEFEAAYLLPLGGARADTDSQVRLMVEWERRF